MARSIGGPGGGHRRDPSNEAAFKIFSQHEAVHNPYGCEFELQALSEAILWNSKENLLGATESAPNLFVTMFHDSNLNEEVAKKNCFIVCGSIPVSGAHVVLQNTHSEEAH
ncbi:hypothetical protein NDU88_003968 [Pleurodeles waltl]|uniref:Uncharacterized protein n=1 Tax=Pleurodeles waltl TaxID=8319 RepID=A0AAV7WQY0_PLEWA|nr:hypothetical protein NDU88_003968 [Pleurodeles waltl]